MTTAELAQPPNRKPIWLLIALFFVPLGIAFLLYYGVDGWRPAGSTNNGDLITPPRPMPELSLPLAAAGASDAKLLHSGKWTLVYVGDGQCDARCREALILMRQARIALGDDMTRVQRAFVATGTCCDEPYLGKEHVGLVTLRASEANAAELLRVFPEYASVPVQQGGRIYIVDPLGNLMMSYARDARPKGLLEDMKKLLRLSHIG